MLKKRIYTFHNNDMTSNFKVTVKTNTELVYETPLFVG